MLQVEWETIGYIEHPVQPTISLVLQAKWETIECPVQPTISLVLQVEWETINYTKHSVSLVLQVQWETIE